MKRSGKGLVIMKNCLIASPSGISIGDRVIINHNTTISEQAQLKIGNDVLIGPNCNILTSNHEYRDKKKTINIQGTSLEPIVMGNDVWLGANVVVLPGVKIGYGAVVGANSVVTKNIDSYTVVGGIPARYIKDR